MCLIVWLPAGMQGEPTVDAQVQAYVAHVEQVLPGQLAWGHNSCGAGW